MSITGAAPPPPSNVFDPSNPNFEALNWNPTTTEVQQQLLSGLTGPERNDGVVEAAMAGGQSDMLAAVNPLFSGLAAEGPRRAKLERFAADNGLVYTARAEAPNFLGCIFLTNTHEAYVFDTFQTNQGPHADFGNYHPYSEPGDAAWVQVAPPTHRSWGFLAIQLGQEFPNLLLISKSQRAGDMTLPIRPDPSQALSLEGDFDRYFTLYCPKNREQEALYLITPDLMALLIDKTAPFDLEVAGDQLFVYCRLPLDLLDENVYRLLFDILLTIGAKVSQQAAAYVGQAIEEVDPPERARHLAAEPVNSNYLASRTRVSKYGVGRVITTIVVLAVCVGALAAIAYIVYHAAQP
jgi:hypothetical protein